MPEGQQQGTSQQQPSSGQQQNSPAQAPRPMSNVAPQQQQQAQQQAQQPAPSQQQQHVTQPSNQQQQQGQQGASQPQLSQPGSQQQQQQQQQPAAPIQPQQPQAIQPTPIQPQQQHPTIQQNIPQQIQSQTQPIQALQQLPQLQQIAPQQTQHVLPNIQAHNMTSVPLSMAMATNPMSATMTAGNLRPQLGQLPQVQVIHPAMHSPTTFMPQFAYNQQQQQLMLQNMQAAMQANVMNMTPQQINMANMVAMQNRNNTGMFTPVPNISQPQTPTTPTVMAISSAPTSMSAINSTASNTTANTAKPIQASGNKAQQQNQQQQQQQQVIQQQQVQQQQNYTLGQVQQAQATAMIGGKPIILGQGSLLQGQIGVISAGQLQTSQAYATGQTFGQIQSKPGQALGMGTNQGQGQIQINSSQGTIRFSQPPVMSSQAGGAQLISSQPVFTNQMIQAMASQLQQFPQQPIMLAQGQTPALSTGQKLYINPVQTQNLMTGVQTAMNTNFKSPTQQNVQTVALPIQKQSTAAQAGKVLLPSMSKAVTAKVPPNSASGGTKQGTAQAMPKPKGRPKGSGKSSPAVTSAVSAQPRPDSAPLSASKPATPAVSPSVTQSPDLKSQSDSEVEPAKKSTNEETVTEPDVKPNETEKVERKPDPVEKKEVPPPTITIEPRPSIIATEQPMEKQRAIVKPHILTHVIEGFVIQEGPEPFPVQRSSLLTEFIPPKPGQPVEQSSLISMDEEDMEQDDDTTSHDDNGSTMGQNGSLCELCSRPYNASNPGQRFCSKSCAKRYNVGCTKRLQHFPGRPKDKGRILKRKKKGKKGWRTNRLQSSGSMVGQEMDTGDHSSSMSQEESPSPATSPDTRIVISPLPDLHVEPEYAPPTTSPSKWNVQEVYEFIKNLAGCAMYADEFRSQEIDGQALLLLKEDHLMSTIGMKLGPALKICARINTIKEETG